MNVDQSTPAPVARQAEISEELLASQTEKVRAVLSYLDTPGDHARSRLFFYARRATRCDADAEEIASQTKTDLWGEKKHAKTYTLTGVVEDDARVLRNWVIEAVNRRAKTFYRTLRRGQKALADLQDRVERERPDYGSYRSAGVSTAVTTEDGESDEPTAPPEMDLQGPLPESPSLEQDELLATVITATVVTQRPQDAPSKKKGKPQPKEPTQTVKVRGGRTFHRQLESRKIARAQNKKTLGSLYVRWPHTCLVLLCHSSKGWLWLDRTPEADPREQHLREMVVRQYRMKYGPSKSTFSDRLIKSTKALEAHVLAIGRPLEAPVSEAETAKMLDKIEAEWNAQAHREER